MSTQFQEGRYLAKIVGQNFIKSTQKGTPGFELGFRVLRNLDEPETSVKSYQRTLVWWLSERNIKRFLHDLHALGYEGDTVRGVDPETENFHNFRNQEIELICAHETNDKGTFEQWILPNGQLKLEDKSELDHFDRLLNPRPKRERTNSSLEVVGGLGITDEDVPF